MKTVSPEIMQDLQREYPLASAFWAGLTAGQRVTLVVLWDVSTNPEHYRHDLLEFSEAATNSSYIGWMRSWQMVELEKTLSKNPTITAQQIVEKICKTIRRRPE